MSDECPGPSRSTLFIYKAGIAAILVLFSFKLADRLARRTDPLPSVPQPNAYETLLKAASEATPPPKDFLNLDPKTISQIAASNYACVQKLHSAVRADTGVPLQTTNGWAEQHSEDVKKLKRLAVVMGVQARAELLDGHTNTSTAHLVDVILLRHALARGGTQSDGIHAMVVETIGFAALNAQLAQMDAASCRLSAHDLEQFETRREPAEKIFQTERTWRVRSFGLVGRVADYAFRESRGKSRAEFLNRYNQTIKRTRQLTVQLAARALELETGQAPKKAADLVPVVLAAVPVDPGTGEAIEIEARH